MPVEMATTDNYLLPSTFEVPPRLARKHTLNTIIEDRYGENENEEGPDRDKGLQSERKGRHQTLHPRSAEAVSPVPSLSSSMSSYRKTSRGSADYDELYDVSDDDSEIEPSVMSFSMSTHSLSPSQSPPPRLKEKQNRYPSLIIPSPGYWPTIQNFHASPPRPPKIPLSPAALSMLGHDLPSLSQPPSLDTNSTSDALSSSSAPVTPDLQINVRSGEFRGQMHTKHPEDYYSSGGKSDIKIRVPGGSGWECDSGISPEDHVSVHHFANRSLSDSPVPNSEDGESDVCVELPPDALSTLQHLSLEIPSTKDPVSEPEYIGEMQETRVPQRPSSADITPASQASGYSLSGMGIPSPSDFFSSLGSNARHTWCFNDPVPLSAVVPPTSTTAEQFYSCPWNRDPQLPIEHVIEIEDADTDGPPTARQVPLRRMESTQAVVDSRSGRTPPLHSPLVDHNDDYEQAIQEMAEKTLDRTSVWLAAQTSYMSALRETNPFNEVGITAERNLRRSRSHVRNVSLGSPIRKAVRFLESEAVKHDRSPPEGQGHGDSIFYHAFQHIMAEQKQSDAFRHRLTRSDSIQSVRLCLPHEHITRLQGQYHITQEERPQSHRPISMFPGKETDLEDQTPEQKAIARVERERQALEQVNARMWIIEAAKYIGGGSLLNSPARCMTIRTPKLGDIENGKVKTPARVLDLGGQPNGDWAWHCSREFPHAKIYTATTDRPLLDSRIRGPRNHHRAAVPHLWKLPFPDNHFHAISARTLFSYLKCEKPPLEHLDEYDLCLEECLRCLRPGGYLEYFILDSEIVNAGSRGTAVSVEFGFNLKNRGYDPAPTKTWLGRVRRAGFDNIKRAWTFLPMGTPSKEASILPESSPPPRESVFENEKYEAVQGPVGSTADVASISGLVGSWTWEQWMLKLQLEMGKENLLEGVAAVLEEGKFTNAGWRSLTGWARKPLEMGLSISRFP